MIRCNECKKSIIKHTRYQDWLALMNYFEHELNEEEITQTTYQSMVDRLMTFKEFACDDNEDEVTLEDEVNHIFRKYGMRRLLGYLIENLQKGEPEDYMIKLKEDLQLALNNYENRYKDEG